MKYHKEFEVLLKTCYARMCAVSYGFVGSPETAEDIVQEVFIKIWNLRNRWDTITSIENFIYTSVRNESLNYLRDRKNIIHPQLRGGTEAESLKEDPAISTRLVEQDLNYALLSAISLLPRKSARLMELVLGGYDNAEISRMLDISINTVKTLKYGAIRRLREYFMQSGGRSVL